MKMTIDKTVKLSLPNVVGYERIAMGCSETFAKNLGFTQERIEDLKTAVAEACLNAMKHGNKMNSDARVIVVMNHTDDSFQVEVWDKGEGFTHFPGDPDIDRFIKELDPVVCFGLFLIRKLVDQVEFNTIDSKGHVVKMVVKKN
jgi:serine/threonine-protein kinase RsbW